jgi:hypothetical protein
MTDAAPIEEPRGRMVRAYAVTGGRTRSGADDLPLEALVATTPRGRAKRRELTFELRSISELCTQPMSVAEVASHLSVPLGVARVLVTDMSEQGLVAVHKAAGGADDRPDIELLERVLNGIRAL